MANKYSRGWHGSTKPRNQRNARRKAPLHMRERMVRASLSKELGEKYNANSLPVRVGDKVKILIGDHRGKLSKVHFVNHGSLKVYLEDVKVKKADGREVAIPFEASNLQIISLFTEDKKRLKSIEKKKRKEAKKKATEEEKKIEAEKKPEGGKK